MLEDMGHRLKRLRKAARLSQRELGERAGGLSHGTVGAIERGKSKAPGAETLTALARALGVPMGDLLGGDGGTPYQREPTHQLGRAPFYPTLVPPPANRLTPLTDWIVKHVPLLQQRAHAGDAGPADPEYIPLPMPCDRDYVPLRVSGECMCPAIEPGDIVIVERGVPVPVGRVALIQHDGELLLKRLVRREGDTWVFGCDDARYNGLSLPVGSPEVLGRVVARQTGEP